MPNIAFGSAAWVDAVLDVLERRIADRVPLDRRRVFPFAGEPDRLLKNPPAEQFVTLWPLSMPPDRGIVAGGGAAHTAWDASVRVDVFARLGTDRELSDANLMRDRSLGFARLVELVVKAVQVWDGSADGSTSPFIHPPRVGPGGVRFNPRSPEPGWGWARVELAAKFRTDFTA